ncbi:MAG: hypothetical protein ABI548_01320 [Polyangiaceae bacterium]
MAKASEFVQALRNAAVRKVETVDEALARRRIEWLRDLRALQASIHEWLGPVIDAGLATATDKEFELAEPDVGNYAAPGLDLKFVVAGETPSVLVRPRGVRVVGIIEDGGSRITGASGRVDIECGVHREILLRFTHPGVVTWLSFSKGDKRVLTDEVFFDLLAGVTGLKLR